MSRVVPTPCGTVRWSQVPGEGAVLQLTGDWTLDHFAALERQLDQLETRLADAPPALDLTAVEAMDTAGAGLVVKAVGVERLQQLVAADTSLAPELRRLLTVVGRSIAQSYVRGPKPPRDWGVAELLARVGAGVLRVIHLGLVLLGFIGRVLETWLRLVFRPWRWRLTATVAHMEQTGLHAVPIVVLLSFLVGAVIAFLGATALRQFGATVFTVDLVTFAFLRELGVLLTGILLAGRTASAFTAQIGSMQVGEEVDAMSTMGLDPVELLVLPRVAALVLVTPLLTFLSMLAGVAGGLLVCWAALDINPVVFMTMFQNDTPILYFWLGLSKAPVFAFLIAVIGCSEGFKVRGSAQSVGERTTSSVVQSIFMVIVADAVAALLFMEMGW